MAAGLWGEDRGSPGRSGPTRANRDALPSLIVIGAQKCGTSSLHAYLDAHPEIAMSTPKELDFFGGPGFANWERGVDWYRAQFDPEAPVRGESSPSYTAYPFVVGTPERIHALVPGAKLIYMVRDPIERLLSQWSTPSPPGASVARSTRSSLVARPSTRRTSFSRATGCRSSSTSSSSLGNSC
jgi:hypothetical protein